MIPTSSAFTGLVNCLLRYVVLVAICGCSCQLFSGARDVITRDSPIRDGFGDTLVSAAERFELGFFTPNGSSSGRRYLGIWYKFSPSTVVWVANRNDPVLSLHGVFRIHEDGNLNVLDETTKKSLWSTDIEEPKSHNLTAKLLDSGNLVLGETLWQSFENPTDTFLPGMKMKTALELTSWSEQDDPATGAYTFKLDDQEPESQYIIMNRSQTYWKSGAKFASSGKIPLQIDSMLINVKPQVPDRQRLMIMHDGRIGVLTWNGTRKGWDLTWSAPGDDQCSIFNSCGNFGICNANKSFPCKCLPGFKPTYLQQWNSGDFSGGCTRRGPEQCGGTFLNLTMMNVEKPESRNYQVMNMNETECRKECLHNCAECRAYSFQKSMRRAGFDSKQSSCSIWLGELQDLQENYPGGKNLFVRVALSDLESTRRNCDPCGTTAIPYPLSTRQGCGDPMYSSFQCDNQTGDVTFKTPSGKYQVISIDPDTRKFLVEVHHFEQCGAKYSRGKSLQLGVSLPFIVTNWCYAESADRSRQREVEIEWELPLEPTCASDADCKEWPNSRCSNRINDVRKRCICNINFRWDGLTLNCTHDQEGVQPLLGAVSSSKSTPLALIVASTVVSVAVLASVLIAFVFWRSKKFKKQAERTSDTKCKDLLKVDTQKRIKHLMNSGELVEEDEEAIDVPFFDFQSILDATDNFSDANKLGQGGYGPVYKGIFPGGQEIAVKRLSSVSGQGLQEFKNEVVLIAKLQHRNLVRLRGYCVKGDEKILLYEYMPNKSLDSIFDNTQSSTLDWEKRFNIILGIARGLLYLHQDSRLRIIHRDLKTSNILLDQDMEPKISDFGLARIVGGKQTEANTERIVGTYGYMSPEYALEGLFSIKSDVFSFGVVLLEIISGKRNTRLIQSYGQALSLLGYAWRLWTENKALELIDPAVNESCNEEKFIKCFKVALLCVQEDPSERPAMSSVMTMLDSESATVPTPRQPAFVLRRGYAAASSSSSSKLGEITVTLEEGR